MDQKFVYIIFSSTNTGIGKFIKKITKNQYCHTSVTLCEDYSYMYSFARFKCNTPSIGGFVVERATRYLSGGKDIKIKVAKVPVDDRHFLRIQEQIQQYSENPELGLYNYLSALLSLVRHRVHIENSYTCIEFAASLLGYDELCVINDLEKLLADKIIYEGSYLAAVGDYSPYLDSYFLHYSFAALINLTVIRIYRMLKRKIFKSSI